MPDSSSAAPRQLRDAALAYAQQGWRVHPLHEGLKTPLLTDWPRAASSDPRRVAAWWDEHPSANIGLATGAGSNLTVLDIDIKDGKPGLDTAGQLLGAGWQAQGGYVHVRTPSRGAHVYLEHRASWGNRKLGELGLDIQGEGAYVVAPPSVLDGRGEKDIAGPYLTVHGRTPVCYQVCAAVEGAVQQLLAKHRRAGGNGAVSAELPEGWEDAEPPPGWLEKLPAKVQGFMRHGDAAPWEGDRSRALWGCCHALFGLRMTPAQVLHTVTGSEQCLAVATADHRRDTHESAVAWLWRYSVSSAIPRDPFASVPALHSTVADWKEDYLPPGPEPEVPRETAPATAGVSPELQAARNAVLSLGPPGNLTGVEAVLEGVLDAKLNALEVDDVLSMLAREQGVKVTVLRKMMAERVTQRSAARKAARLQGRPSLEASYVYVEGMDMLWSFLDNQFVTRPAFAARWGLEAATEAFENTLQRVGKLTYWPQNPWRPGFDATGVDWRYVSDDSTGQLRLNIWQQPRSQPVLGATDEQVEPYTTHLERVLRIPPAEREHLLDYLAYTLQYPERKVNHMVLLGGAQGVGKSFVFEVMTAGLGPENVLNAEDKTLDSSFDPDVRQKKLMLVGEMFQGKGTVREGLAAYNGLKKFAAAPPAMLSIVLKGRDAIEVPNLIAVMAETNKRDAVVLEQDDRRMFMTWAGGGRQSPEYYNRMRRWMDGGGRELVAGWLLSRDVSEFEPGAPPPETDWKREVLNDSFTEVAFSLGELLQRRQDRELDFELVPFERLLELMNVRRTISGREGNAGRRELSHALNELGLLKRRVQPPAIEGERQSRFTVVVLGDRETWSGKSDAEWCEYLDSLDMML